MSLKVALIHSSVRRYLTDLSAIVATRVPSARVRSLCAVKARERQLDVFTPLMIERLEMGVSLTLEMSFYVDVERS